MRAAAVFALTFWLVWTNSDSQDVAGMRFYARQCYACPIDSVEISGWVRGFSPGLQDSIRFTLPCMSGPGAWEIWAKAYDYDGYLSEESNHVTKVTMGGLAP